MGKEKVLILGGGKSGVYAAKVLLMKNFNVILYDENTLYDDTFLKKEIPSDVDFSVMLGDIEDKIIKGCKFCVISPGFPKFKDIIKTIRKFEIPIIGELELGYQIANGNMCAITGSNGKTTVTSLVGEIMKRHYIDVHVLGNIGEPYCKDAINTSDKSCTVLECSSFQLEDIAKFRPNVAAILNLSPDHLNRYYSYEDYINAKLNIASNMTKKDYLILNYDDDVLRELAAKKDLFKCKIIFFSRKKILSEGLYINNDDIYLKESSRVLKLLNVKEMKLLGEHNYENVMAAIAVSLYMGVSIKNIVDVVKEFRPIVHRIEFVREKGGVKFYNDSKATNPDAAIKGINAMQGKTILIAGGADKGVDFGEFVETVKEKVRYLILIGEAKKIIANKARTINYTNIVYANTLEEAVDIANSYANIGDNVLLSPACASFDMFASYEERGNRFKEKVMSLK